MNNQNKQKLFARFIAGISSNKEQDELLKTPELEQMMLEQWKQAECKGEDIAKPNHYKILTSIYKRLGIANVIDLNAKVRQLSIYRGIALAAASVALVFSVGTLLWQNGTFADRNIVEVNAPLGTKSEVFLPDGSRVWLNSESTLSYNKNFDASTREVSLEGEAYFNISYDPQRPMVVNTKTGSVEVLGTRFNLLANTKKGLWEATLVSGSINVLQTHANKLAKVSLDPGQKASWNQALKEFVVTPTNTLVDTRWVSNQLVFENETFGSIARDLERIFGVEIIIPTQMAKEYRFTAKFTDESLHEIFNLLRLTAPFNFSVNGNRVEVAPKQ